jgi:signal transduction histidine kinase
VSFDEAARLEALRDYDALSAPTGTFDEVARVASRLSQMPVAVVTLLAETQQLFKGKVGLEGNGAPRQHAFCNTTIRLDAPLVVPDLSADERFSNNPWVTGSSGYRFYCGVPVRTPEGHALGTLCVLDTKTRELDSGTVSLLQALAHQVEAELEVRRRLSSVEEQLARESEAAESKQLLAAMVAHDLRSPLTTILLSAEVLKPTDDESVADVGRILDAAERMRRMLRDFLDVTLMDAGRLKLRVAASSLPRLLTSVASRLARVADERGQVLRVASTDELTARGDVDLLERVVTNLVGNALAHGPANSDVTLRALVAPSGATRVEVIDAGECLPLEDRARLFRPRARGLKAATQGYGLGLAFSRMAVEAHGGRIGVEPHLEGGNCFFFEIP